MNMRIIWLSVYAMLAATSLAAPEKADSTQRGSAQIAQAAREISPKNIEATIRKLVSFGTRHTLSDATSETRGIGAARRWIQSEFERYGKETGGRLEVTMDEFTEPPGERNPEPVQVVNVVATLRGSQPESRERMYVVTGHYDSRVTDPMNATADAPGANDDASGVAAVLEMARVMSKREWDATLVFIAMAGEEQGLFGSTHWARMAKEKGWNVAGMITNDIIGSSRSDDGRIDNKHVRLFAEGLPPVRDVPDELLSMIKTGGENDSSARELARFIKTTAEKTVPGMTVNIVYRRDRYLRGGDHSPFLDAGFAAVRMTEPNEDFRHQHQDVRTEDGVKFGDLPEFCDFDYIAQVGRVNAAALGALALAPAAPTHVKIETKELTNDTTLTWRANEEPDVAGYQIVWRETTEPLWEKSADAGDVTRFTLPKISKDNYLFGVCAVDSEGNVSPAVYPAPAR
ncbi:MAG: M20/M25/M40 family metallo-hydrolase [Chthoniobacterales bacterium]|nr:M20/M25/M40 family metallo-hydrolase [Chthoniobacterales bacterium]